MRRDEDPSDVLIELARAEDWAIEDVRQMVTVFRDCIDELLADDYSLAVWPLLLASPQNPVARTFAARLGAATEEEVDAVYYGDGDAVASWLRMDRELYNRFPIAGEGLLVLRIVERLEMDPKQEPATGDQMLRLLRKWLESFAGGRPYRMSRVGLERDLETWLVRHLDRLHALGYPVTLSRQQWILADRRRPDLICRFEHATEFADEGDWLVIELKAGAASLAASDQISGYVAAVRRELATKGQGVIGLLVTDGASAPVQERLDVLGIHYLSLVSLGYREALTRAEETLVGASPSTGTALCPKVERDG